MKRKILTRSIPIRLPENWVKRIDRIAEKKGKARSTLIREWIEKGMEGEK